LVGAFRFGVAGGSFDKGSAFDFELPAADFGFAGFVLALLVFLAAF